MNMVVLTAALCSLNAGLYSTGQEAHQRDHLDQRKPHLHLAEHLDRDRFSPRTSTRAHRAKTHCGTWASGSQYFLKKFIYRATAVTSTIEVIAQFSQYSQPAVKAAFSPKNSRA